MICTIAIVSIAHPSALLLPSTFTGLLERQGCTGVIASGKPRRFAGETTGKNPSKSNMYKLERRKKTNV
jgi:hypothetical protein